MPECIYNSNYGNPPIHLRLIFEISNLKNLVRQTRFFVYFQLDFYCLCSLQKSSSKQKKKNPVHRTRFFKLSRYLKNQVEMDRAIECSVRYDSDPLCNLPHAECSFILSFFITTFRTQHRRKVFRLHLQFIRAQVFLKQ